MSLYLHKSSACNGNCGRDEANCDYAHSIHSWTPKHPSLLCYHGSNCKNKETTCCRIHDGSLPDKIRLAKYLNIKFVIPYEPKPIVMAPKVVSVAPKVDPLYELQVERAMIQTEMEALDILKKKLELRILEFKKKASDYWEAGSKEMDF